MHTKEICIATRESPLALAQADFIETRLASFWPTLTLKRLAMSTTGDRFLHDQLRTLGGKGLFVKELEEALLDGRADLAVHSMKDVPVNFPKGLSLAVVCARENPFDAFISPKYTSIFNLPEGASVGTSSLRRQAQLLALRPDLQIKPLRGNVGTRLNKLNNGEYDAIVLATAGLKRLNLDHLIVEQLDESTMLPVCGQGALGLECRTDDEALKTLLTPLHDASTTCCVQTEREVNAYLGGSCHTPVAIYCKPGLNNTLILNALVASRDGRRIIRASETGPVSDALALAKQCAMTLLDQGAQTLIHESFDHDA
ncbi:MAG: hydroxymethylbilane synthase [Legionellaceae bacterium]